jgi:hypothetical protein
MKSSAAQKERVGAASRAATDRWMNVRFMGQAAGLELRSSCCRRTASERTRAHRQWRASRCQGRTGRRGPPPTRFPSSGLLWQLTTPTVLPCTIWILVDAVSVDVAIGVHAGAELGFRDVAACSDSKSQDNQFSRGRSAPT